MTGEMAAGRRVLAIGGADRVAFLQGLVTNDVRRLAEGAVYAALLTPQGKYLSDFFLVPDGDRILLDVAEDQADSLTRRLTLYRLRADVTITPTDLHVHRGLGPAPDGAFADPRHPTLGWRAYRDTPGTPAAIDWDALRVAALVPEAGIELIADDSYILETGFERLNGVDFRKGCYVGQEVTARMKHKTELRKGLAQVRITGGPLPIGTEILSNTRAVGRLFTQSAGIGLAHLRFDQALAPLTADGHPVERLPGTGGAEVS